MGDFQPFQPGELVVFFKRLYNGDRRMSMKNGRPVTGIVVDCEFDSRPRARVRLDWSGETLWFEYWQMERLEDAKRIG